MYEERLLQPIEQVVILITEKTVVQTFIKDKRDYLPLLKRRLCNSMKKIIKHILALTIIFIILLVIGIIYSITNTAKADQHPMFQLGTMKQTMSFYILVAALDVYGHATNTFKQIFYSMGRCKIKR